MIDTLLKVVLWIVVYVVLVRLALTLIQANRDRRP